jgi:hypothetical protein
MTAEEKELSLEQAVTFALEEARTVVPGIQALFGFQLVAVFNQRFSADLSSPEQHLHLAALLLSALACALVMAPAAFHRRSHPRHVSARLLSITSAFVRAALGALMGGVSLDAYLISRLVTDSPPWSLAIAAALLAVFVLMWFVFPRRRE